MSVTTNYKLEIDNRLGISCPLYPTNCSCEEDDRQEYAVNAVQLITWARSQCQLFCPDCIYSVLPYLGMIWMGTMIWKHLKNWF